MLQVQSRTILCHSVQGTLLKIGICDLRGTPVHQFLVRKTYTSPHHSLCNTISIRSFLYLKKKKKNLGSVPYLIYMQFSSHGCQIMHEDPS